MIKIIWSWLMWQLYQGSANRLLVMSQEVVKRMDSRQKLAYVMNAIKLALLIRHKEPDGVDRAIMLNCLAYAFVEGEGIQSMNVNAINIMGKHFKLIAMGKIPVVYKVTNPRYITPSMQELAYAFWSLTRMLAIVYPMHGFRLDIPKDNACSDSEALTRIATSAVGSVAAAYGHEKGVRAYGKVYREMIDHGRGLNG